MPDAPDAADEGAHLQMVSTTVTVDGTGVNLHLIRHGEVVEVEIQSENEASEHTTVDATVREVQQVGTLPIAVDAQVRLVADHPADRILALPEAVADAAGFPDRRDLLQLRRPLPFEADHRQRGGPPVTCRPFVPGSSDEDAWLRVNNRAFATHPDQGRETAATLHARMAEPWFDPAGFLVADDVDRPGELSGFCWTKVHAPAAPDPALGEIYVIGVDPAHRGEGLGPAFVIAGLDHLAGQCLTTAVLYVDADNTPAVRLYERLGFTVHARRRVYSA